MTLSKTFSCCDNNLQIKRNETFFNIKQKEKKEKNDSLVTPVNKTFLVLCSVAQIMCIEHKNKYSYTPKFTTRFY